MLAHLRARAIAGVERVGIAHYSRTVRHEGESGTIEVTHSPDSHSLVATVRFPERARSLSAIVGRAFEGCSTWAPT